MSRREPIVAALLAPETLGALDESGWDLLIRQGRRANLLGRLAHVLREGGLLEQVPVAPRHHLHSALLMVERQHAAMDWEVECIRDALGGRVQPVILLKGAAYVMAGLPTAHGRTFSDVDILVPRTQLEQTESQLMIHGWQTSHQDPHDQRYYRLWSHEIPPMRHVRRGTTIDVHHAILPVSGRVKVNNAALLASAFPLSRASGLFVLQPVDMLLHSATHLFHEGELGNGLRDLFDLDSLFRHFGSQPAFWEGLPGRAKELGLGRPLYYAIRYTRELLDTPIPGAVVERVRCFAPPYWVGQIQDACYLRMLRPHHASARSWGSGLAGLALYVRSHWMRMPFVHLILHLAHQVLKRPKSPQQPRPEPGLGRGGNEEG